MSEGGDILFGMFAATVLWLMFFWLFVIPAKDDSWKRQIEDHGCGGYYLDANRDKQWNWKP